MEFVFRGIFWLGVASLLASLFIDFITLTSYFVLAFFGGILLVIYSLFEQYLQKKLQRSAVSAPPAAQQPQPGTIAKRLVPLQEIQLPSSLPAAPPPLSSKGFFAHLLSLFHFHKQRPAAKPLPLASLDNVKQLFTEEIHLQRQQPPSTFQRPATSQPVSFSRPPSSLPQPPQQRPFLRPTPPPPQEERLPFEEGLEHYIPVGAEQLHHDHHNRYEEERETLSQPSDKRYQQVSQQQRPSPQPSLPHHLSLLRYLHYKDRRHEQILFIILLCLSIVLIITSLLLPFQEYIAFVVMLLFLGLILLAASLAELVHLHRHAPSPVPALQPQQPSPAVAQQQPVVAKSFPSRQQPTQQSLQQQPAATEHLSTLITYVHQSLQQHYPLDAIRAAAKQSGWPDTLIQQALFAAQKTVSKKKKGIILISLVAALLVLLIFLNTTDMLLLPYWLEILGDASPQFYYIMMGIFLLIILLFVKKVRKVYKAKKIHYRVEEEQHIAEIKEELQRLPTTLTRGTYETDFDRLYHLIAEKKKLTITEVAQGFSISRKEAEEWGKILQEQGLIELHYPTVGDLELRWKK